MSFEELDKLREEIAMIDEDIMKLVSKRLSLAEKVGQFKIDNGNWDINSFEYNGETNYTKNDKIAWNYRNGYKEKTFDKTVLKGK